MNPDELRRLACLLRENRLSPGERQEWADLLVAWASTIERARNERLTR